MHSSLENRLHIKKKAEGHYLCHCLILGKTPEHMAMDRPERDNVLINFVHRQDDKGQEELKAKGYEHKLINLVK